MTAIPAQTYTNLEVELKKATHQNAYRKQGGITSTTDWFFSIIRLNVNGILEGHICGNNVEIKYRIDATQQIFVTYNSLNTLSSAENMILREVKLMVTRTRALNAASALSKVKKQEGRSGKRGEYYLQRRKTAAMSATLEKAKNQKLISDSFATNAFNWGFSMWEKKT